MKKQILILDDDACVRDSLQKVLVEIGYEVIPAPNGAAGLARLKERKFDLLLLDLDLPDLTGFDVLDWLNERMPAPPVIVLTGMAEQCAPGSLVGAAVLLHKPVDVLVLLRTIEMVLAQPPGARARELGERAGAPSGQGFVRASGLAHPFIKGPRLAAIVKGKGNS